MKFDLPWRIHWRPGDPVDDKIVASILQCRPLAVILEIERVGQLDPLRLPWEGVLAVIVYRGWRRPDRGVVAGQAGRWEFPVDGPGEAKSLADGCFLGLSPAEAAFRWYPGKGHLRDLAAILKVVRDSGCGLTLPNRPAGDITSQGSDAFPDVREFTDDLLTELKGFTSVLRSDRVRVHDFILTEALGLEGVEPQGCEAGNSMAFVDPDGRVYPCETLMVPLGDLRNERFEDIWASPLRQRIRRDVASIPRFCSQCPDLGRCRAGCRGAVYHLKGHYGAPDPLCPMDVKDLYERKDDIP
ncbi:MAG: SPASM domain-containing protein [bacterium]|nr:MAG: SPASM domain-containing protein [bacterium]